MAQRALPLCNANRLGEGETDQFVHILCAVGIEVEDGEDACGRVVVVVVARFGTMRRVRAQIKACYW